MFLRFLVAGCVCGVSLLLGAGRCEAQLKVGQKAVLMQRFLLLGDRKHYISMQRHVFRVEQEEVYKLTQNNNDVLPELSGIYVMRGTLPGLTPLYRLKHMTSSGKEFYTISEAGAKDAIAHSGYAAPYDIIGYVSPIQTPGTVPLFRLYRGTKPKAKSTEIGYYDDHLYTIDSAERQKAVKDLGYVFEKVECYVWPAAAEYSMGGVPLGITYRLPEYDKAATAINAQYAPTFGAPNTDPVRTDQLIYKLWSKPVLMQQEFSAGLSAQDASKFYRKLLQNDGGERSLLIGNVVMDVYGRYQIPFNTTDTDLWDGPIKAGNATYATILAAELKKLNSNPSARKDMIERVYIRTMGRMPIDRFVLTKGMQGEQTYWGPRSERYSEMMRANRDWLYSPGGSKDLSATVARALKVKLNRVPTEKEVLFSVKKYTWDKLIFSEMVAPVNMPYLESQIRSAVPQGIVVKGGSPAAGGRPAPLK
ncbi:hypothetical protein EON83_10800 [bacterium]|nr:MAG: hypothetical protein EON83_10800 [bacterium]